MAQFFLNRKTIKILVDQVRKEKIKDKDKSIMLSKTIKMCAQTLSLSG